MEVLNRHSVYPNPRASFWFAGYRYARGGSDGGSAGTGPLTGTVPLLPHYRSREPPPLPKLSPNSFCQAAMDLALSVSSLAWRAVLA